MGHNPPSVREPDDRTLPAPSYAAKSEPDPCVVETAALARVLNEFADGWTRKHPQSEYRGRNIRPTDVKPVSPYEALSTSTGIPMSRIDTIRIDRDDRPLYTELRIAESLVASIDRCDLFDDGTLRAYPNPRFPRPVEAAVRAKLWNRD
jgi:hypothetical protein